MVPHQEEHAAPEVVNSPQPELWATHGMRASMPLLFGYVYESKAVVRVTAWSIRHGETVTRRDQQRKKDGTIPLLAAPEGCCRCKARGHQAVLVESGPCCLSSLARAELPLGCLRAG